jgi:hypothetical protein
VLSELLDRLRRFRPSPGPPARVVGVPRREGEDLAGELGPVFARLEAVEHEIAEVREAARRRSETLRREAVDEAARVLARAGERAPAEEARAAAERHGEAAREARRLDEEAQKEARRIAERAERRLPDLVERVRDCVAGGGR